MDPVNMFDREVQGKLLNKGIYHFNLIKRLSEKIS